VEVGMNKLSATFVLLIISTAIGWNVFAEAAQEKASSRAYVGHETDQDIQNFIQMYPAAAGTRLDDCQTCHRGGVKGTDTEREFSPCGYCHLLQYPNPKYKTGVPKSYAQTLNSYGAAYNQGGRTMEALAALSQFDSDGDGAVNAEEIAALRNPGDPASRPGQAIASFITLSWNDIQKLPRHRQFMLMNATHEPTDQYAVFSGIRIRDLLEAARVDLSGATGITVFAPDGYSTDYTLEDALEPFPRGYYYAATTKAMSFVQYPKSIPPDAKDGKEIPQIPWLLLALERDGKPLSSSTYEKGTGKLTGEGPYRSVKPQRNLLGDPSKPGRPDRSANEEARSDGWDYSKNIDHNAGFCVRGVTVLRVNPVPEGFEEYDWKNTWHLVSDKKLVIYGSGIGTITP